MEVDSLAALSQHTLDVVVVCPPTGPVTALTTVFGVPMIVHVLAPWVEQRCAKIHLCVEEGSAVPKVVQDTFRAALTVSEIVVPKRGGPSPLSFTDSALVAYASKADKGRDTVVVSGNALLSGISLSELVSYLVASESSAAVVLWEGNEGAQQAVVPKGSKGKPDSTTTPAPTAHQVMCALEDEKHTVQSEDSKRAVFDAAKGPTLAAFRLHLLQPAHAIEGVPTMSMGAAARSPSLSLSWSHTLLGVCFVKSWVLGFLVALIEEMNAHRDDDSSDEDSTLTKLARKALANELVSPSPNTLLDVVIPAVSASQHWKLTTTTQGSTKGIAKLSPQDQLGWQGQELRDFLEVPHWTRERTIAHNNTAREYSPQGWDRVRATAVVVKEAASSSRRVLSPSTNEDLVALSYDVAVAFGPRSQSEPVAPPTISRPVGSALTVLPDLIIRKLQATNASLGAKGKTVGSSYSDTHLPSGVTLSRSCVESGVEFQGNSILITNSIIQSGAKIIGPVSIVNSIVQGGAVAGGGDSKLVADTVVEA